MIKKIFWILFLLVFSIISVNSVTYLNSCGKDSDWVDGETYIINFNNIPSSYTDDYCFYLPENFENATFIGNNINIETTSTLYFFKQLPFNANHKLKNVTFKDFNITKKSGVLHFYYSYSSTAYNRITENSFENITINTYDRGYFIMLGETQTYGYNYIDRNNFKDIFLKKNIFFYQLGRSGTDLGFFLNNLTNILVIDDFFKKFHITSNGDYLIYYNNSFTNMSLNYKDYNYFIYTNYQHTKNIHNNYCYNCMITDKKYIDNNNDNIDDAGSYFLKTGNQYTTNVVEVITPVISLKLFGYNTINNYYYGDNFISPNEHIIIGADTNYTTNGLIAGSNDNNIFTFVQDINLINRGAIDLDNSNDIDCDLLLNSMCIFSDLGYSGITTGDFRGLVTLNSNNIINNIWLEKNDNQNNAHILSNSVNYPRNNIQIKNSYLIKQDSRNKNGNEHLISLWGSNIHFVNNTFRTGGASGTAYELLRVKSENKETNKIYLNNFTSILSDVGIGEIFTKDADVLFFNNYIDAYYVITNNNSLNINVSPLVAFYNSDDNKIYYYYLGNYYKGFSDDPNLCNDSDSNGICDNPYTSGAVTDNYPLSEYPFDYKNHLFSAYKVVDLSAFNITIYVPEAQDLIYNLESNTELLEFAFAQDSQYPDLTCSYIINGVPKYTITNVNNSIQKIYLSGFNEGYYTFYVECYNDFAYNNSEIYSFFVNYPGGADPPSNYTDTSNNTTPTSGENIVIGSDFGLTLITTNPTETTDNVVGFMSSLTNLTGYGAVIGILFVFITLIGFIFAIPKMFIK